MSEVLVLDSSAVLAYVLGEPGADEVEIALEEARESGTKHLMTSVNWGEALYVTAGRLAHEDVLPVVAALDELPITVVDAGRRLAVEAARLKHVHGLGYADAFAAGLALALDAPLLATDTDFEVLRPDGLRLRRLR